MRAILFLVSLLLVPAAQSVGDTTNRLSPISDGGFVNSNSTDISQLTNNGWCIAGCTEISGEPNWQYASNSGDYDGNLATYIEFIMYPGDGQNPWNFCRDSQGQDLTNPASLAYNRVGYDTEPTGIHGNTFMLDVTMNSNLTGGNTACIAVIALTDVLGTYTVASRQGFNASENWHLEIPITDNVTAAYGLLAMRIGSHADGPFSFKLNEWGVYGGETPQAPLACLNALVPCSEAFWHNANVAIAVFVLGATVAYGLLEPVIRRK